MSRLNVNTITNISGGAVDLPGFDGGGGSGGSLVINVKDYGAKGDGATDDYASITSAINAAAGNILAFPPGEYLVSQTLIFNKSNSSYIGYGNVLIKSISTVKRSWNTIAIGNWYNDTTDIPSNFPPTENILFESIDVDYNLLRWNITSGTDSNLAGRGQQCAASIGNAKNVIVRDCHFMNGRRQSLDITVPRGKYPLANGDDIDDQTPTEVLLTMPIPAETNGNIDFGAQYIYITNCETSGAGDDNLATHYVSDIFIDNLYSHDSLGRNATSNTNAMEIDDGSRNITISNCILAKCYGGLEIKGHQYAPAPYNVNVDNLRVINCAASLEIHHTYWSGDSDGEAENAWNLLFSTLLSANGSDTQFFYTWYDDDITADNQISVYINDVLQTSNYTVSRANKRITFSTAPSNNDEIRIRRTSDTLTLQPGTEWECETYLGFSPMHYGINLSNIQIIAPNNVTVQGTVRNAQRLFEVGGVSDVQISNIYVSDGYTDTYIETDGYIKSPTDLDLSLGLFHIHDGCRNISFTNVDINGFGRNLSDPLATEAFNIVSSTRGAFHIQNLNSINGPDKIIGSTGGSGLYFGVVDGCSAIHDQSPPGPAFTSSNNNIQFRNVSAPDYGKVISANCALLLLGSEEEPSDGTGGGSVYTNRTGGALSVKTTGREDTTWLSAGAIAIGHFDGGQSIGINILTRVSQNVAQVDKISAGVYDVYLATNLFFNDRDDVVVVATSGAHTMVNRATLDSNGNASFTINTYGVTTLTASNPGSIKFVCYGPTIIGS